MPEWEKVNFSPEEGQAKPEKKHFLIFSLKAHDLKALTGVYRRSTKGGTARALDPNVQRGHEEERSKTIRDFVRVGFPWCEMSLAQRDANETGDLLKPGWLPTAILVNILPPNSIRNGVRIPNEDLIEVEDSNDIVKLHLPTTFRRDSSWKPSKVFPLEVIDGQHRLWAFDDSAKYENFELPVVACYGFDRGWQAYLFWSVNITPKKINRSLAFDLYPLLRQQTWLEKYSGHQIYRETRCQELVEALWSHPKSPWFQRINMLGETKENRDYKGPSATQAAWVRSLSNTFVKKWEGTSLRLGGLFGPPPSAHESVLPWNRPMQAAFLIYSGNSLKVAIRKSSAKWAKYLREVDGEDLFPGDDPAFYGPYSLISTDQGIRGFLFVINDLLCIESDQLELSSWRWDDILGKVSSKEKDAPATDEELVTAAIKSFGNCEAARFVNEITDGLSSYDWRTSSTPKLDDETRLKQAVFRGSSGYREMRRQLLHHLSACNGAVKKAATSVIKALAY